MYRPLKELLLLALIWAAVFVLPITSISTTVYGASKSTVKKNQKKAKVKAKTKAKKTAKKVSKCDKNYSGCVPIAKDVDCKPGNGNGPAYLYVVVKVLKKDIYKLDSDKDGLACEK